MYIVQLTDNDFKVMNLENKSIVCIHDLIEFSDGEVNPQMFKDYAGLLKQKVQYIEPCYVCNWIYQFTLMFILMLYLT